MKIFNAKGEVVYETSRDHLYAQILNNDFLPELNLDGAVFDGICLEATDFFATSLVDSSFKNCDLYWADFSEVNLGNADFEGALLRGCNFEQSNLSNANFKNADFALDNMGNTPVKLQGANLDGAILDGADFTGALYNAETIFPQGFSPLEHGMVFDDEKKSDGV